VKRDASLAWLESAQLCASNEGMRRRCNKGLSESWLPAGATSPVAVKTPVARTREHDSIFHDTRVMVFFSSALVLVGAAGLWYFVIPLMGLWSVDPMLVLPQLVAAILVIAIGLGGFLIVVYMDTAEESPPSAPRSSAKATPSMSLEALLAATHDYRQVLPHGVTVVSEYCEARYPAHIVGQVGPVCAAASVSSALNVLNDLKGTSAFRVRDTMRIYQLMFLDKRAEALAKLSKVVKISDVSSAIALFHEQV
jgi:hypothetical protein